MKLSKCQKQGICILFALAIVLSGICTSISQGNAFLAYQNIPEEAQITSLGGQENTSLAEKPLARKNSSQKYQVIHTSFAKEDCRIEDNSAKTLQKAISVRTGNRKNKGKFEDIYMYPAGLFFKCLKIIHNQYIERSKAIVSFHKIMISSIHRKDGAKGICLFF